jgi:hypothetical protein
LRKISLVLTMILIGCALTGPVGRLETVPRTEQKATPANLTKNWQNYDVYSDGPVDKTAGVILDPKDDDRNLIGFQWVKAQSQGYMETAVNWISSFVSYNPKLYKVFDEKGKFYGYVFVADHRPIPTRVDERTLMIPKNESPLFLP